MSRAPLLLAGVLLAGCNVEPAPEDLDTLMTYFFDNFQEGDDAQLAEAVRNFEAAAGGAALEDIQQGEMSRLGPYAAELAGFDEDPANAAGVYIISPLDCTLDQLGPILTHLNQDLLYAGVYDEYERRYVGDPAAWLTGGADRLDWEVTYTTTALRVTYVAQLKEELRRVPDQGEDDSPYGAFVMSQRRMSPQAEIVDGDARFDQDYKAELYYEVSPGKVVHLHAMWREIELAGLSTEDNGFKSILLDGMKDWDEVTNTMCAEGLPE